MFKISKRLFSTAALRNVKIPQTASNTIKENTCHHVEKLTVTPNVHLKMNTTENGQNISMNTSPTMTKFLSGFKRFHKEYFDDNHEIFDNLRNQQSPKTILIGCSDSRVDPAIITDCEPGDLFVVRNVANLVAPYKPDEGLHGVSAALEFAVKSLKVEMIVVLGHAKCGGINNLMYGKATDTEFIGPWMKIAQRAKERTLKYFGNEPPEVQTRACEQASVLLSLENLLTYPWIKERVTKGELSIGGWYFDIDSGELLAYNAETTTFESFPIGTSPTNPNGDLAKAQ